MKLVGSGNQAVNHYLYSADGTITAGGTAQLVLARSLARSFLRIQNLSNGPLYVEFGSARAIATLTSGVVTSVAVTNAGFGFKAPPVIRFLGGGLPGDGGPLGNSSYFGLAQPGAPSPSNFAQAHAVLTTGAVSSIVIDNGGSKYVTPPLVFFMNSDLDPFGCALPAVNTGILLTGQGDFLEFNGTVCPTDAVAVYGATTGQAYVCRYTD